MEKIISNKYLSEDDYATNFLTEDYLNHKQKLFESKNIEGFLSDEELQAFDDASKSDDAFYVHDTSMAPAVRELLGFEQETTAHYHIFNSFYDRDCWKHLVDIIQPKIETHFGPDVFVSHIHVLDSRVPYGIHTDAQQPNIELAPIPAWTFIIPLDDYDSRTYEFNERSSHKSPWDWVHNEDIPPRDDYTISKELWERDFHPLTDYELFKYLSIESVFQWKKGSLFAADRYRFHCSDNYFNRGIKSKRAIIAWTSTR